MPKSVRNTSCDIDFLSPTGVFEYIEDELSKMPPKIAQTEVGRLFFTCLREKLSIEQIKIKTNSVDWYSQPFELQSIAVGLKLFRH